MNLRAVRLILYGCFVCLAAACSLEAAPDSGKISGVVVDSSGTPQMGASVVITSENLLGSAPIKLLTNDRGGFASATLPSGLYSVKVTLAGFLPSLTPRIEVNDTHATFLQVVVASVFASLGDLRQGQPERQGASDDWVWVLRAGASSRPVLRWNDGSGSASGGQEPKRAEESDHGLVELSSGGERPMSPANSLGGPGTAMAYDVPMGARGRILIAGQFSYVNQSSTTGVAAAWLPTGEEQTGSATTLVMRQAQFGPGAPVFRGARLSHDAAIALGDRINVRYGSDFVYAGFGSATSAVRPRAEVAIEMSPNWQISMILATRPWDGESGESTGALQSAVNSFDAFPTLMARRGKPVFENGTHQEIVVKHTLGNGAKISAAVFHDKSTDTAVLGQAKGAAPSAEFIQGFFGSMFAYDGGNTASMGTRVVYEQPVGTSVTWAAIYDYAGALAPKATATGPHLRNQFGTRYRQSLAGRVSARLPGLNTRVVSSYKWIDGAVVSQLDPYGESTYGVDPFLSMGIRQPLPGVFPGHMVVEADMGNILGEGATPMTASGRHVIVTPAYRYLRGGLSFQF